MHYRNRALLTLRAEACVLREADFRSRIPSPDRDAVAAFWGTNGKRSPKYAAQILGITTEQVPPYLRKLVRATIPSFDRDVASLVRAWRQEIIRSTRS